jgi:hypothetical protein
MMKVSHGTGRIWKQDVMPYFNILSQIHWRDRRKPRNPSATIFDFGAETQTQNVQTMKLKC